MSEKQLQLLSHGKRYADSIDHPRGCRLVADVLEEHDNE